MPFRRDEHGPCDESCQANPRRCNRTGHSKPFPSGPTRSTCLAPPEPDDKPTPFRPFQSTCLVLSSPAVRQSSPSRTDHRDEPSLALPAQATLRTAPIHSAPWDYPARTTPSPFVRLAPPSLAVVPLDYPSPSLPFPQTGRSRLPAPGRLSAPFHTGRPAHPSPATFQFIPHRRAALHPAAPIYVVPGDFPSRTIPTPCTPPRSRWSGRVEG